MTSSLIYQYTLLQLKSFIINFHFVDAYGYVLFCLICRLKIYSMLVDLADFV